MAKDDKIILADRLLSYCKVYNVPLDYLFEILEDQKVTPMIRGKAMEYNAYLQLKRILPRTEWSIQKLNLNAQPGTEDQDISVTHKRTGIILTVESKSAERESINTGEKTRILKVPHFKVKCHRSRSNMKKAKTSNDRYSVDSFDVVITNTSNAVYQGNTVSAHLEVVHNPNLRNFLYDFYSVSSDSELVEACENDWRYCISKDIAKDGFIPRTPYVQLENDKNWKPLSHIEEMLSKIVEDKRRKGSQTTRRN